MLYNKTVAERRFMVNNVMGAPVRGDDFYGRDRFVELVWRELAKGSVLLAAPRRFGKTSVMYRLIDQPQADYKIIHADLEHLSDPVDLMLELVVQLYQDTKTARLLHGIAAITKDLLQATRETVDEVELFDVKLKLREQMRPQWQEVGRQVFRSVGQASHPVLFILDEFPMMIDRMARQEKRREEARILLNWLRALRQSPEMGRVRFLIAGSIGIDAVLSDLGETKAINDFQALKLEPFTPEVADHFLLELAETEKLPLTSECRQKILDLVGILVPYFLQILYSEVSKAHFLTGEPVTPALIDRLYREKVLGVDCKTYFEHYYGRLRDYYTPREEKAVKRLLRELARVGAISRDACFDLYRGTRGGETDADEFNATISNLENDFYIRYDAAAGRYEFACKMLRDWWLRHYALEVD
jgi:AAA+ ATPase superfamily predicted ATPase